MANPARKQRYTYADLLGWPEGERWELIDGQAWDMSAAPSIDHQGILGELFVAIAVFLRDKPCRAFPAPFDVRLPGAEIADDRIDTVVHPDIVVVCDPAKLDRRGCLGAPDWVVEILSPATAAKDQGIKRALYERHGVREFWLVHPADRVVIAYRLEAGAYGKPEIAAEGDDIVPALFPGLTIAVAELFARIPRAEG